MIYCIPSFRTEGIWLLGKTYGGREERRKLTKEALDSYHSKESDIS